MITKQRKQSKKSAPAFSEFSLKDQVVVITGGAGQLGFQFSKSLGEAGASVILADVDEASCKGRIVHLKKFSVEAGYVVMDISNKNSVKETFGEIKRNVGRIDVLINAAAAAVFTPFEERTYEDFMRVLQVNVGGVFLCCQAATEIMKKQKTGGRIINIASVYGVVSSDPSIYTDCKRKNSEVYSASKAAVIMMTKYLAVHLAPYHIRVNAVSPGGVFNEQGSDFVNNYAEHTALGRMANEHEISSAVLYLASDASSYVTGHNLVVDGGLTAW